MRDSERHTFNGPCALFPCFILVLLLFFLFLSLFDYFTGNYLQRDMKKGHVKRDAFPLACPLPYLFFFYFPRERASKRARSIRKHTGKTVRTSTSACSTCKVYHIKIQLLSIILRFFLSHFIPLYPFVCVRFRRPSVAALNSRA